MPRKKAANTLKMLFLTVLVWCFGFSTYAQKVNCPNFSLGNDSLNKLITRHLPVDSAKYLYFQFGWSANNLRLYSNVIVDAEDIMPYRFYKEVEKGFEYTSTEKLQFFYLQYEYANSKSTCWIRNTALENPPERKPKLVKKEEVKQDTILDHLINPEIEKRLKELQKRGNRSGQSTRGEGASGGPGEGNRQRQAIETRREEVKGPYEDVIVEAPIGGHTEPVENRVYESYQVDKNAAFDGGMDALYEFIANNIQYPEKAKHDRIRGTVYVQISITKEGYLGDVRVASTWLGYGLEQEAIRVIKLTSGMWTAAKYKEKSVAVSMQIPVKFEWPN